MTTIKAEIEVRNRILMGIDTCGICNYKSSILTSKPCICTIFKKELERYNPYVTEENPDGIGIEHWEYKRLQECKDSEI